MGTRKGQPAHQTWIRETRHSPRRWSDPNYVIETCIHPSPSEKPCHSSCSSTSESDSRFLFASFSGTGCSTWCSSPSAMVTQVNRLPFVSYVTTGDISAISLACICAGGGRSDRSYTLTVPFEDTVLRIVV